MVHSAIILYVMVFSSHYFSYYPVWVHNIFTGFTSERKSTHLYTCTSILEILQNLVFGNVTVISTHK